MFSNNPDFMNWTSRVSVSAISTSTKNFFNSISLFEAESIGSIHIDVMDGHFVPRLGMHPELIEEIRSLTSLPLEIHLMVSNPFDYIRQLSDIGVDRVIPHIESTFHIHRLLQQIMDLKLEVGIAINPGTSLFALSEVISYVDNILLMGINPGIKGHKLIPATFARIKNLREMLESVDHECLIDIDGGVTFENLGKLKDAGANRFVCGAGTIFKSTRTVSENFKHISEIFA